MQQPAPGATTLTDRWTDTDGLARSGAAREPFVRYGVVLGCVLLGYLLFDRAFAYVHPPGAPLFVGELTLLLGVVAAMRATGVMGRTLATEPVLALVLSFMAWGAIRTLPGILTYGLDAVRDAALWYYALAAPLACAAAVARPELPHLLAARLARWALPVLVWLAASVLLMPMAANAPRVPFSDVSVLSHKPGSVATATVLVLAVLWLLPARERTNRVASSLVAMVVMALVITQNRGSLIGFGMAVVVILPFLADRVRIVSWSSVIIAMSVVLMLLIPVKIPMPGLQGREYSAQQLVTNVVSLSGKQTAGNLEGTVDGRKQLWTRVLDKQVDERRLVVGAGFGPNLAAEVGVKDDGEETLRNPHNTHLSVLARMGVLGLLLWVALWTSWFARMLTRIRHLRHTARHEDAQLGVTCVAVAIAVLVTSAFDPQLEGPHAAIPLWSLVGIGLAVTGRNR